MLDNKLYKEIEDSRNSNEYIKIGKKDSNEILEVFYYYHYIRDNFEDLDSLSKLKEYINYLYEVNTNNDTFIIDLAVNYIK